MRAERENQMDGLRIRIEFSILEIRAEEGIRTINRVIKLIHTIFFYGNGELRHQPLLVSPSVFGVRS